MMVLDSSGKYEPGEGGWLSVAFKPTMEVSRLLFYFIDLREVKVNHRTSFGNKKFCKPGKYVAFNDK